MAFRCTRLEDMMAHLQRLSVPFRNRQVDDQGLFQLFLLDPSGVKIELNFANAEAQDIKADLMASAL